MLMSDSAQIRARTTWSAPAKRAFRDVIDHYGTPDKATVTAVYTAIDLLSAADKMQARIDEDGLMVAGSQGQLVAHPLVAEVRQYRRQSQDILRALSANAKPAASAAGAALAQKRWTNRPAAGATVTPINREAPF